MSERCGAVSVFEDVESLVRALKRLREAGQREMKVYSPVGLRELEPYLPRRGSPVRFITLAAAVAGCAGGFWMCIGSAHLYDIIVGGKWPAAILPYCVVGFEATILIGGLTALAAILIFARLRPGRPQPGYDARFGEDQFGICVFCPEAQVQSVANLLKESGAREVHEHPERTIE